MQFCSANGKLGTWKILMRWWSIKKDGLTVKCWPRSAYHIQHLLRVSTAKWLNSVHDYGNRQKGLGMGKFSRFYFHEPMLIRENIGLPKIAKFTSREILYAYGI